jgi:hypothetical protein
MEVQRLASSSIAAATIDDAAGVATPWTARVSGASRSRAVGRRVTLFACLALSAGLVVVLGARRIGDEGAVSLQGDMARYLVDGTYFYDLARDRPFASLQTFIDYTRMYFARYPALSLGHHPMLLPIAEVAGFAAFGVSVASARLVVLLASVLGALCWFLTVRLLYDDGVAVWATLLLMTMPLMVQTSQSVMSEAPTLALILAAVLFLVRFARDGRTRDAVALTIAVVFSVYAKHLAALMLPIYAGFLLGTVGPRRLLRRDAVVLMLTAAVLMVPVALLTWHFGAYNVSITAYNAMHTEPHSASRMTRIVLLMYRQVALPTLLLAGVGAIAMLVRRDRGSALGVLWVTVISAGLLPLATLSDSGRYAIYWLPAFALLAGSVAAAARGRAARAVVAMLLIGAIAYQARGAVAEVPVGARGYEEAARFVVSQQKGATILYNGIVDTGYFVFFVRKHDPERHHVVLRADKLLTTSEMADLNAEQRITDPADVYTLLDRYGTAFVVTEDVPVDAQALNWLKQALKSDRFIERRRIPIVTSDRRLRNTDLVVYEYRDAKAPQLDAPLHLNLPVIRDVIDVRLDDLLARRYLR